METKWTIETGKVDKRVAIVLLLRLEEVQTGFTEVDNVVQTGRGKWL